jgi:beta-xylosidase
MMSSENLPAVEPTEPFIEAAKESLSGNPIFPGWYADPEIHIFANRYFVYPTFSAPYEEQTYFDAFSSPDLKEWTHHHRIFDFVDVPWSTHRAAWAPSAIERDGKYYFYFSAGDGAGLGVAVADDPAGPFRDALGKPLVAEYHFGAQPIDAHAFMDDDGQAYLYWGGWSKAVVCRLGQDMISLEGDIREITPADYVEGPFMFKRHGVYYFTWSEGGWGDSSYSVAYAKSDNPFGPFERVGTILKSDPKIGNGAGHHSVLELPRRNGQDDSERWLICYHRRPIHETSRHSRVTCIDNLHFDENGDILPVEITHEGVMVWQLSE